MMVYIVGMTQLLWYVKYVGVVVRSLVVETRNRLG